MIRRIRKYIKYLKYDPCYVGPIEKQVLKDLGFKSKKQRKECSCQKP